MSRPQWCASGIGVSDSDAMEIRQINEWAASLEADEEPAAEEAAAGAASKPRKVKERYDLGDEAAVRYFDLSAGDARLSCDAAMLTTAPYTAMEENREQQRHAAKAETEFYKGEIVESY